MAIIYLALGSNVGDKDANLKKAITLLRRNIKKPRLSRVYKTRPVGYEKQDNFLNMAIEGSTNLGPKSLLKFIKDTEKKTGRIRRFRWGPREIDIDIIFYGDGVYKDKVLQIPHRSMHQRDFVLKPLMDLNPELIHPVYKKTVRELYSAIPKAKLSVIGRGKRLK
jgi:2-amino-4-hydroxy-6-hydroxymethyldihydropteridine diphosphokinase